MKSKKNLFGLILIVIYLTSCKKECIDTNENTQNKIKDKIKMYRIYGIEDSISDINYFYFNYDTISGDLIYVDIRVKNATTFDTFVHSAYRIVKYSNNLIYVYANYPFATYKVRNNGYQITSIDQINYFGLDEPYVNIFFDVNNKVDSIYSKGSWHLQNFWSNFKYSNFEYNTEGNIIGYNVRLSEDLTGSGLLTEIEDTVKLYYKNIENTNILPMQTLGHFRSGYGSNGFGDIAYILSINGYYLTKQNNYLLDRWVGNQFTGSTDKYNYTILDNKVTNFQITTTFHRSNTEGTRYCDIEYY